MENMKQSVYSMTGKGLVKSRRPGNTDPGV